MTQQDYGRLLRSDRKNAKKTMADVAAALGVTVTYVSDVERGKRAPWNQKKVIAAARVVAANPSSHLAAAAGSRGQFTLSAQSSKQREVGAALMRAWDDLDDDMLEAIEELLGRQRGAGDVP